MILTCCLFSTRHHISLYSLLPPKTRLPHVPKIKKSPIISLKKCLLALTANSQRCFFISSIQSIRKLFFCIPSCSPSSCASTVKAINPVRGQTTIKISNRKEKKSIVKLQGVQMYVRMQKKRVMTLPSIVPTSS